MKTVWVVIDNGEVYGIAKDKKVAYDMLKTWIKYNYQNDVTKIIKAIKNLNEWYNKGTTILYIETNVFAEEWGITE